MHPVRVAAIAVLMGLTAASTAMGREASGDVATEAMYGLAMMKANGGDAETVLSVLEPALDPAIFDTLSDGRRYEIALLYGEAARRLADWPKAHRGMVLATGSAQADAADWRLRLRAAIWAGDASDTYASFLRLQKADVPILGVMGDGDIDAFDQVLRRLPDGRAHLALGRQMEREGWQPIYISSDPSVLWLHYVEALLATGDRRAAVAAAGRIVDPAVIMAMHADRRFDEVIAANPSLRDPQAAAEQSLAAAQAYLRENPRSLSGRVAVARALAILRRAPEAIPMLEDARHQMAMTRRGWQPPFDDPELMDSIEMFRASALIEAGRMDEAIVARIARTACGCETWASLQVARTLLDAGRAQEALRWIREAPPTAEPRTAMRTAQVTACIAAEVKDDALAAQSIAYLRKNDAALPDALVDALICAGRLDEAATVLVRQVADPATRLATLTRLQALNAEKPLPGFDETMKRRWARVAETPALKAQIDKVGRLNRFSLAQFATVS